MIVTVTPNPSLDRTYELGSFAHGEVNRAGRVRLDAGGKGINVSRALVAGGADTVAVFPSGGSDGARIVATLAADGVASVPVEIAGSTRSNVTLAEDDGTTTKVNAPGPRLTRDDVTRLLAAVADTLAAGERRDGGPGVVVGAGSLPDGTGADFYVRLAQVGRAHGARVVVDTSDAPLEAVARAGCADLLKPNDDELADLVGRELRTVGDVVLAAREVLAAGTERTVHGADEREALVSLGSHGALLVTARRTRWAGGAPLVPASTVGAGDVTLAAYLRTRDLAAAVAAGRAAVLLPGSAVPTSDLIRLDDVRVVEEPDPTVALKEL
jgi:1-phosphofructokinase